MRGRLKASKLKDTIEFLPTIIRSGYSFPWVKSVFDNWFVNKSTLNEHTLWVPYEVHEWLRRYLKPYMRVFEYGSGGSTIFFAERVKEVIAVEHDYDWKRAVEAELLKLELKNVTILMYKGELDFMQKPDYAELGEYRSTVYPNYNFKRYVKSILTYPDNYFDLVSIDGVARPSCVLNAMSKVKPNGYIMIADSDRSHYRKGFVLLENWKKHELSGPKPTSIYPGQTTIWKKPD
jgi:hypothetical protein